MSGIIYIPPSGGGGGLNSLTTNLPLFDNGSLTDPVISINPLSSGIANEHQITDNSGGFTASIMQESAGVINVGGTADPNVIFSINSATLGFSMPRHADPSVSLPAAAPGIMAYSNASSAPEYIHPVDGWIPVGRYAGANVTAGTFGIVQTSDPSGRLVGGNLKANSTVVQPLDQATGANLPFTINLGSAANAFSNFYGRNVILYGGGNGVEINSANAKITGTSSQTLVFSKLGDYYASLTSTASNRGLMLYDDLPASPKTINSSAILELDSTTRGFLPPRMTSAEMVAISTPAEGLIVHATDADRPHYNDGTSWKGFGDLYGLYAQTTVSSTVTGTTPASVVGAGVGSLTVPANGFKVGDSFHAKIGGEITNGNGDTITIDILADGTTLATTGSIALSASTANGWEMEIDFTMQTIGATASVVTNGNFAYNRNTGSLEGIVFQDTQTIDTTTANTLDIRVTWGQTGSTINSTNLTLYRTYTGS